MIRSIFAALCLLLSATSVQAAGRADLEAAKAAAEKGTGDEAIQLFTQALAAGDLTADDQFAARLGRGREYSGKSLIADAFDRRDDGQRLRDNAIADFSAAFGLKADDASVLIERGQDYHLNQQFDAAISDFSAALKLNKSPSTLVQRAASQRAKGAYDEAIADCTAALAGEAQDAGLDVWDIHNERGYAEFLAALGASSRADDVLWLPYQLAWLHIGRTMARWDAAANAICRCFRARTPWARAIASRRNSASCAPTKCATFTPCSIWSRVPN